MLRRLARKNSSSGKNIIEKFLEFIDSPIWVLPIANFIEHRSVVFDRQQGSITMYEKIHKEFIELVDTLTECFCADSGIPVDSLRQELKNAEADKLTIRQKVFPRVKVSLFPIAAAGNFNVFVPMMMRKNVELQLQALQMIEFMCGLIPSVLQIEDGETLRNKPRLFSPEETERYVLIAVMRQSKEEFDNLSKLELEELEELLRSSEEERRRLEQEQGKEQELFSLALSQAEESTKIMDASPVRKSSSVGHSEQSSIITHAEVKSSKETETKRNRAEATENKALKSSLLSQKDQKENTDDSMTLAKVHDVVGHNEEKEEEKKLVNSDDLFKAHKYSVYFRESKRPPTAKRANTPQKVGKKPLVKSASVKGRRVSASEGFMMGPRNMEMTNFEALLQEPNRLNSAAVRSREEYLRMQRDRLLQMKAIVREKQMSSRDVTCGTGLSRHSSGYRFHRAINQQHQKQRQRQRRSVPTSRKLKKISL
ncbi:unnamed protein product [Angiostrongylus costaricensis]|uniref:Cilia- and flagella-associated protein 36 n=1 Tax=Angiostrongylus costaricensis TaxID=334426 RepID=A0A158PG78_ANGCS|nr:unnamed protein product [Angiostrongylus costaricensis]